MPYVPGALVTGNYGHCINLLNGAQGESDFNGNYDANLHAHFTSPHLTQVNQEEVYFIFYM